MTDELREALAVLENPPNVAGEWDADHAVGTAIGVVTAAARRWADFPTDEALDAAWSSKAARRYGLTKGATYSILNAALLAVKDRP